MGGVGTLLVAATWTRNFNPFVSDNRFPTANGVYEPSMIYNTIKGELLPWLATKYEWSSDNKKLTLTYRTDVKWSDGQPFTAKDVAYTFNLQKANKGLVGGGQNAWAYLDSVAASSDTAVDFTFKEVYTVGLYDIVGQNIVPEHVWKDVGDPVTFTNENPVGTGPFTEVKNFQNQIYEVHKNPNYWQPEKQKIAGIWVNADSLQFQSAPSFYAIASSRPIKEIADERTAAIYELGINNIQLSPTAFTDTTEISRFENGLVDLQKRKGLFIQAPGTVEITDGVLYRAHLPLSARAVVGDYTAETFLIQDGRVVAAAVRDIEVRKSGLERFVANAAEDWSLLYGLAAMTVAVLMGILAGWIGRRL